MWKRVGNRKNKWMNPSLSLHHKQGCGFDSQACVCMLNPVVFEGRRHHTSHQSVTRPQRGPNHLNSLWIVGESKSTWTEPTEQGLRLGNYTHNLPCRNGFSWQQLCISVRGRQRCAGRLTGLCCQDVVWVSVNNINFHLYCRQLWDWGWCRVQSECVGLTSRGESVRLRCTCARAQSPADSHLAYLNVVLRPEHRHSLC